MKPGYPSSANKRNLGRIERHLVSLQSPLWPEHILPKIDKELATLGEAVFRQYECHLCHSDDNEFKRYDKNRRVKENSQALL